MPSLAPARGEPGNPLLGAVGVALLVLLLTTLQATLRVTVHGTKRVLARLCQFLWRGDNGYCSLLTFYGITACINSDIDHPFRHIDVTIVVDADFADHVAWISVTRSFEQIRTADIA
jgi:hypothetical protein